MNYALIPYKKNGTSFRTKTHTYMTDEGIQRYPYYLKDYLINENGNVLTFYQLHTKVITQINTTMAYHIECPKCRTTLNIQKLYSDGNQHSWYVCPKCNQ